MTIDATPDALAEKYFPKDLIQKMVGASNAYRKRRKENEPNLKIWTDTKSSAIFTLGCIYHFLALLYYFGIVKLPSKSDYWSTHSWMPIHPIATAFGMSRNRFQFLWRHFHIDDTESGDAEDIAGDEEETEEDLVELSLERVQREQEMNEENNIDNDKQKKIVWYEKLAFLIDHTRNVSKSFIWILGTALSIDEMMIRFSGRSAETHRIKNKPIKEGYKFFVLATKSGYIVNFTPDGRKAARVGEQEYEEQRGMGKIESMVLFLVEVINE